MILLKCIEINEFELTFGEIYESYHTSDNFYLVINDYLESNYYDKDMFEVVATDVESEIITIEI